MKNPGKVSLAVWPMEAKAMGDTVIRVRRPSWSADEYHVFVNGKPSLTYAEEDGYIQITLEAGGEKQQIDIGI